LRHPRFGYRRLHALLRRSGRKVNLKRVRRLCVEQGLKLGRKVRRKRSGIGNAQPCRAEYPDPVWAYDFVHDWCENGRKLKFLTVEDEFTRQCLAIEVDHRLPASAVCRTLLRLFGLRRLRRGRRSLLLRRGHGHEQNGARQRRHESNAHFHKSPVSLSVSPTPLTLEPAAVRHGNQLSHKGLFHTRHHSSMRQPTCIGPRVDRLDWRPHAPRIEAHAVRT
jgi:transposase InsO family protein